MLHRDVKPGNIFLAHSGEVAKLGDLGNTRILENTKEMASTSCGTPFYMSPELGNFFLCVCVCVNLKKNNDLSQSLDFTPQLEDKPTTKNLIFGR